MGRIRIKYLAAVLLLVPALTFATTTTQPSAVDAARKALDDAEAKLAQIIADAAAARAARNQASHQGYLLQRELGDAYDRMDYVGRAAAQAGTNLDQARQATDAAAAQVDQLGAAIEPTNNELQAAISAVKEVRLEATKAFQTGAEVAAATEQIKTAQESLSDEIADVFAALNEDPAYQKLQDLADAEEKPLERIRAVKPLDQAALTAASTKWLAAKAAVETKKGEVLAEDFFVIAARQQLAAAQVAKTAMLKKFDADLQKDPRVVQAIRTVSEKHALLARIKADFNRASADLNAASAAYSAWSRTYDQAQRELNSEQYRADGIAFALDQARLDDTWYQSLALRGEDAAIAARREVDAARAALQLALANQSNPPSPTTPTTPGSPNTPPTTQVATGGTTTMKPPPESRDFPRPTPTGNDKSPRRLLDRAESQLADAAPINSDSPATPDASRDTPARDKDAQQDPQNARQAQVEQQRSADAARAAEQAQRTAEQNQARIQQAQQSQQQNQSRADAAREEMERKAAERGGKVGR